MMAQQLSQQVSPAAVVSSWNWPVPTLDATEFSKWASFPADWAMKNWLSAVKLMIVPAAGRIPGTRRSPPIQRVDRIATSSGAAAGLADGDGEALGAPTPRSFGRLIRSNPPTTTTMVAATVARTGSRVMLLSFRRSQRIGRRACGVVCAAWRTAATTRSGASSGPSSSHA
jgi:hypothetical protein